MGGGLQEAEKLNTDVSTFDNLVMPLQSPSQLERVNKVCLKNEKLLNYMH
jgi:hypothetical protein